MTEERFYAHGKLLITGEYAVLRGAEALAVPTRAGQMLHFLPGKTGLQWRSYARSGQCWLKADFNDSLELRESSDQKMALFLQKLLQAARQLAGGSLAFGRVNTYLEFSRSWGLGSSSTLIHLVAQWFQVDAMQLFFAVTEGSGYDVACAGSHSALLYQLEENNKAHWEAVSVPAIFEEVLFVHLNQKQRSLPEVQRFLQRPAAKDKVARISQLSHAFLRSRTKKELQNLMSEHEALMAEWLELPPVKDRLFADFEGSVKSLGAWGGDFVMALGNDSSSYFRSKGFPVQHSFAEMTL